MLDIQDQLSHELFHKATIEREIELLTPRIESGIVQPKVTTNLRNLTKADLNVDVVPIKLANMALVQDRKAFYYARKELATVNVNIESLKNMYNTYKNHMQQALQKEAKTCSDVMIFDAYHAAKDLKNLLPEEKTALKEIGESLLTVVNSSKEDRWELYETLQNIINQHA
jgi:hypothetical protein